MDSFIDYLKNNKKGLFNIWYKNNIINNEKKFCRWELNTNNNFKNSVEVCLITNDHEYSKN